MKFVSFLLCCFLMVPTFAANIVVGKVDIQKIIVSIKEGKKVRSKLEGEFTKKKKELTSAENKIRKAQEEYQKQQALFSADVKRKKEQEIQSQIIDLQKKTVEYQKQINDLEKKYKKPILDKLKPIVANVSKQMGVTVTFEVSAAPIVYAEKEVDITDKVIAAYDKKYPSK